MFDVISSNCLTNTIKHSNSNFQLHQIYLLGSLFLYFYQDFHLNITYKLSFSISLSLGMKFSNILITNIFHKIAIIIMQSGS